MQFGDTIQLVDNGKEHSLAMLSFHFPGGRPGIAVTIGDRPRIDFFTEEVSKTNIHPCEIEAALLAAFKSGGTAGADFVVQSVQEAFSKLGHSSGRKLSPNLEFLTEQRSDGKNPEAELKVPTLGYAYDISGHAALYLYRSAFAPSRREATINEHQLIQPDFQKVAILDAWLLERLNVARNENEEFRRQLAQAKFDIPAQFTRTEKQFYIVDPVKQTSEVIEVLTVPGLQEFYQRIGEIVANSTLRQKLRSRILRGLEAYPLVCARILTSTDSISDTKSQARISSQAELKTAFENRGESAALQAYTIDSQTGVSEVTNFAPPKEYARYLPQVSTVEETLWVMGEAGLLPKLQSICPLAVDTTEAEKIRRLSVAEQCTLFSFVKGHSEFLLRSAAPIKIPEWVSVMTSAPARASELPISNDYRVTAEGYATSIWRWNSGVVPFLSSTAEVWYEVRWHTKPSNFLKSALPSFVVTRTILSPDYSSGDGNLKNTRRSSQVLTSLTQETICDLAEEGFILNCSRDENGSYWVSEEQKKKLHHSLRNLEIARLKNDGDSEVARLEYIATISQRVNPHLHFEYVPLHDVVYEFIGRSQCKH